MRDLLQNLHLNLNWNLSDEMKGHADVSEDLLQTIYQLALF